MSMAEQIWANDPENPENKSMAKMREEIADLRTELEAERFKAHAMELQAADRQIAELIEERDKFKQFLLELEKFATRWVEKHDVDNKPDDYSEIWEARRVLGKLHATATKPAE